jgi:hypothetical protein
MNKLLLFVLLTVLFSCAIESVPTGGEKDITPPEVIESSPINYQTNFESTEIELTFDEFVELKNFNQQFSVSPPLENKVDYNLKGKTLNITILDTLKENTTYTLNFGNSIVDITEGNPQTSYKFVFSTGPVLDSLKIQGEVHHAKSGKPMEGLLAMLYLDSEEDSVGYKSKPQYYAVTQEDGSFSIENIKDENYRLLVVDDKDFNFKITSRKEPRGFVSDLIRAGNDSIYQLRTFVEENTLKFNQLKQTGRGKALVYYSADVPDDFRIREENDSALFIDDREGRDTLTLFYKKGVSDTSLFYAQYADVTDTLFVRNAEFDKVKPSLTAKKATVTPSDVLTLTSNKPIENFETSFLVYVKNGDTVNAPKLTLAKNGFDLVFDEQPTFGDQYNVHFIPGFVSVFYNQTVDTASVSFKTKKETDYAFHIISLTQKQNQQSIIQLLDEKNNLVFERSVTGNATIEAPFLEPAGYILRVILDENKNGVWDTGNYLESIQPEQVLYYPEVIELRANWEIETIWDLK